MRRTYLVLLIGHKTTVKKHRGEANTRLPLPQWIPSRAQRSGLCLFCRCFSSTLIFDLDRENGRFKLKHFSKLDFQTKRKVINNGRPMPELKGTIQTKLKGMLLTPHSLTLHWYKPCTTGCDGDAIFIWICCWMHDNKSPQQAPPCGCNMQM